MKPMIKIFLLCTTLCALSAQSTLQFEALLTGGNAIPTTTVPQTANATLSLQGNQISSEVFVPFPITQFAQVKIFSTLNSSELGAFQFALNPGIVIEPGPNGESGGRVHSIIRTLSDTERADLTAGNWWMSVHDESDSMLLRGQLTVVPEPGILVICAAGLGIFLIFRRENR
jgi:hypothetical protein